MSKPSPSDATISEQYSISTTTPLTQKAHPAADTPRCARAVRIPCRLHLCSPVSFVATPDKRIHLRQWWQIRCEPAPGLGIGCKVGISSNPKCAAHHVVISPTARRSVADNRPGQMVRRDYDICTTLRCRRRPNDDPFANHQNAHSAANIVHCDPPYPPGKAAGRPQPLPVSEPETTSTAPLRSALMPSRHLPLRRREPDDLDRLAVRRPDKRPRSLNSALYAEPATLPAVAGRRFAAGRKRPGNGIYRCWFECHFPQLPDSPGVRPHRDDHHNSIMGLPLQVAKRSLICLPFPPVLDSTQLGNPGFDRSRGVCAGGVSRGSRSALSS